MDVQMPDMDGMDVLREIKEYDENLSVVMVTATDSAKAAVKAMRLGASGYITKPFDPDEVAAVANRTMERVKLFKELAYLRSQRKDIKFDNIIGKSRKMEDAYRIVEKVAKNNSTVFISGGSGTGKELIARAIHFNSLRAQKPFVVVDCASIPPSLIESELFGHEKGAFTDAINQKIGMFELADEGTLFLDEISDLKIDMQAKLLRALEEREIKRLGSTRIIKVDVRVVSATNIDIVKAMDEGRFRQDLYYRLNVVPVDLPLLRERKDDIPLLAEHFLRIYNQSFKRNVGGFTREAVECLMAYDWPGNVRELKNIIERLVVLKDDGIITVQDLPFDIFVKNSLKKDFKSEGSLKEARKDFEKQYIEVILSMVGGNQTEAARILGIHRNALFNKMKNLGLKE